MRLRREKRCAEPRDRPAPPPYRTYRLSEPYGLRGVASECLPADALFCRRAFPVRQRAAPARICRGQIATCFDAPSTRSSAGIANGTTPKCRDRTFAAAVAGRSLRGEPLGKPREGAPRHGIAASICGGLTQRAMASLTPSAERMIRVTHAAKGRIWGCAWLKSALARMPSSFAPLGDRPCSRKNRVLSYTVYPMPISGRLRVGRRGASGIV